MKKSAGNLSLSESIDTDGDGNSLSLMDVISVDDDMFDNLSAKQEQLRLRSFVESALTPREQRIIVMRYGLDNRKPKTQREVADICKISRSYVSRIEKKALSKLKKCFDSWE